MEIPEEIIEDLPISLYNGKLGICLFRFFNGENEIATNILKDACNNLKQLRKRIDLPNGLAGVGFAVNILVKYGFIKGNVEPMLRETDDAIYRQIAFDKGCEYYDIQLLIQLLYYMKMRYEMLESDSENQYLQRELIIKTVNQVFNLVDYSKIQEPMHYSLDYILPQLHFVMGQIASLGFYKHRIQMMMRELSPLLLSAIPLFQANRLYMLAGVECILKYCDLGDRWHKYYHLLIENIDINSIINSEIGCRSIYINNGVSSLYFLIRNIKYYSEELPRLRKKILKFIDNSPELDLLKNNKFYLRSHIGLYNGYFGVALARLFLINDKRI